MHLSWHLESGTATAGTTLNRRLYVGQDANGNVTSLTDATGAVVERYAYGPYGTVTVLNPDGSVRGDGTAASSLYGTAHLFQGGRFDPTTGLYHFDARDYDPSAGRWAEQDPARYVDGASRYQFVGGSPVGYVDPSGLTREHWDWTDDLEDRVLGGFTNWGLKDLGVYVKLPAGLASASDGPPADGSGLIHSQHWDPPLKALPVGRGTDRTPAAQTGPQPTTPPPANVFKPIQDFFSQPGVQFGIAIGAVILGDDNGGDGNGGGAAPGGPNDGGSAGDPLADDGGVPDGNSVVKGGTTPPPEPGTVYSGSHGPTLSDAGAGVPHGQVQPTTAGEIRTAGGSVTSTPELNPNTGTINPQHVDIIDGPNGSPMGPPQPNPVPKGQRFGSPGYKNPL